MHDKKFMSHRGHVIWYNWYGYMVALDRDGTDRYFETWQEAMKAIDDFEDTTTSAE